MVYGLKKIMNHYLKKLNYFKLYEGVTNMDRLDYSSKRMEEFAIRVISKSYDCKYSKYIWHDKDDDFDFTSPDDKVALEVATILPQNIRNAIEYEKTIDKGKKPDSSKVYNSKVDDIGELLYYHGSSMDEIRKLISVMVNKKEKKRKKRLKIYSLYELCLCINDGGLFNDKLDFDFIISSGILKTTFFSKLFLITASNFFVISDNLIVEYDRKI